MDKTNRKAIESRIVLAVQEVLKSSNSPASDKLDKLVKSSAKQIAKKLSRLLEEKNQKRPAAVKKSVIKKTAAGKKAVPAKKTVKVIREKK